MTLDGQQYEELHKLIGALCDGAIDAEQFARLQAMLAADIEAQRFYVRYLDIHGALGRLEIEGETANRPSWVLASSTDSSSVALRSCSPSYDLPPTSLLSLSGVLLSYVVAAMIFGAGTLAAWRWGAPVDSEIPVVARNVPERDFQDIPPGAVHSGTITRLVDCRWADPIHAVQDSTRRGKFDLTSGLAELAFDGGATVILEGPVLFLVDSPHGGFLAHGKATVRVGRRPAETTASGGKTAIDLRKNADCPLFCVRTPTATVTDRGDVEFTLQVNQSRASYLKILRGRADFQCRSDRVFSFKGGDWAFVEVGANRNIRVNFAMGGKPPVTLTRRLPPGVPLFTGDPKGRAMGSTTLLIRD